MTTQEDVIDVANSIGQELTEDQVEEVIATYDGTCEDDWELAVEEIINDILYA